MEELKKKIKRVKTIDSFLIFISYYNKMGRNIPILKTYNKMYNYTIICKYNINP